MRRGSWILAVIICISVALAGCGKKDATDVVSELSDVVSGLEHYHGSGLMTIHTGAVPQEYKVDVSYQKPSYYRIALTNAKKNITQIVLRNDDGVFVITPNLNKSFRFKSDWPDNQGQVYLYETLIRSIIGDETRQFVADDQSYVFDVAANYNSHSLERQKIWLNKKDYTPKQVQVSDSNAKVVVDLKFDAFDLGAKFNADYFSMKNNMNAAAGAAPQTMAEVDENGNPVKGGQDQGAAAAGEGTAQASEPDKQGSDAAGSQGTEDTAASDGDAAAGDFGVIQPTYVPEGVALKDNPEITESDNHSVMLRYEGTYNYTIVESRPSDFAVMLPQGTPVQLSSGVGVLTGEVQQTLTWLDEGVQYKITSGDLPVSEMIQIAASMEDQSGK
ncbi:DUF4367 domain-containing protein [Paenibacillus sp. JX-17]|uniref:DUF4367 domain-containing protein n=1 Tax=Paenibacillus lacisoli TaxID=3064525 RepID=A0ABT9CDB5_9BACL|nr:outer membrane lipoprotein-sorting protein [Paenibacillus sp. JX-17]MDO7907263.1 DUF4367 domain-containing protein [Paenibacillus sp. JX-17]